MVHCGRTKTNRFRLKLKMFRLDAGFFLRAVKEDAQTGCAVSVLGSFQAQTRYNPEQHCLASELTLL